ncbi:hypothetical protein DSL72_005290 [Monilinia vaccinii-corymbosi]|uniref:Myb-like DNA-binding domain-containing protein n=1 Tax=Monilinia vaccinii-corymbosi TaxID=61207 RepID=A0A8A3PF75_9HELO|nr:hypothetical protein DSL72_005290 [Monilinia vaccinii-corymbosi]
MAPASNEEQFKFLISCIRYSNNGKVDFGQVAKECKIVTKGAAAKRYERMMRSHGIAPNAASIKPAPGSSTTTSSSSSTPTSTPRSKSRCRGANKKRKFSNEDENVDDDEEGGESTNPGASKSRLKREIKGEMGARANVKEENPREDFPSAQLQEGLRMGLGLGLGAGLCDVNRELVDYYSVGGGSVNGDAGGLGYGDVEGYASTGMTAGAMSSGAMVSYSQQPVAYNFDAGGYGGMMGNRNGMGGHGGQNLTTPISQQYQSMRQGYESQGDSECPLLVE